MENNYRWDLLSRHSDELLRVKGMEMLVFAGCLIAFLIVEVFLSEHKIWADLV